MKTSPDTARRWAAEFAFPNASSCRLIIEMRLCWCFHSSDQRFWHFMEENVSKETKSPLHICEHNTAEFRNRVFPFDAGFYAWAVNSAHWRLSSRIIFSTLSTDGMRQTKAGAALKKGFPNPINWNVIRKGNEMDMFCLLTLSCIM